MIPIKFASDCIPCPDCGEPYCEECDEHYADCSCLGPSEAEDEGYIIHETEHGLFAETPGEIE